jgi:hypothetical protein
MQEELISQEIQDEVSHQDTAEETSGAADEQTAGTGEDSETSAEEEQEEKPRKHKGGFQRRIDRLTEEKRYLESLVQQLAAERQAAAGVRLI